MNATIRLLPLILLLAVGCEDTPQTQQLPKSPDPASADTVIEITPEKIVHGGTWMQVSDNLLHLLIQNDTHRVQLQVLVEPVEFPVKLPAGFPWGSGGGAFDYKANIMTRSKRWAPQWPDDTEEVTRVGYYTNGDNVEIHRLDVNGVSKRHRVFRNRQTGISDSPLFGTWKLDNADIFLIVNGSDAIRFAGDTKMRLSSIQANKYELNGDYVIMERYCDYKSAATLKAKQRFEFERTGNSLVLKRVNDTGEILDTENWFLVEAETIDAPPELGRLHKLDSAEDYYKRAEQHRSNGLYGHAHEDYSKAIELDPTVGRYFHRRGDTHMARKIYLGAILDYTDSMTLRPDYPSNYFDRAGAYLNLKKFNDALEDYKRYQELAPDAVDAYTNISMTYLHLKDAHSAIENINKAIELEATDPRHYILRASAYLSLKDAESVIENCTRAIELDETNPAPYLIRASAYLELKDYQKVIADCTKAIEIAPQFEKPYELRATVYNMIGQREKAMEDLDRVKQIKDSR